MSKKNKRKWYQLGTWGGNEIDEEKFSNTIAKHNERLGGTRKFDEDGFEILEEDDLSYHENHSYDYNWDRKLLTNQDLSQDRKSMVQQNSFNFQNQYNSYQSTGVWRGYAQYREPTLSYRYVQQIASALSASHAVRVIIGNNWEVDLIKKTLTYNPTSLIYGTKGELLATLMHEIGKLRFMEHYSKIRSKFLTLYRTPAQEVLACFEDVRVDYQMLRSYESAGEIYESAMPAVEKQASSYQAMSRQFIQAFETSMRQSVDNITKTATANTLPEEMLKAFGLKNSTEVWDKVNQTVDDMRKQGNIYDYCAELLREMYDLDTFGQISKSYPYIGTLIDQTTSFIEPSKKQIESQGLVDYLNTTAYPVVEKLLKDFTSQNETIKKHFPDMDETTAANIATGMLNRLANQGKVSEDPGKHGKSKTRNSGPSQVKIPPEWEKGEYKPLKDSVMDEIKQLINKLTFLRREEMTARYEGGQKRGKLDAKKLYRLALGNRRVFKKKLPNTDTIQSFAFSVLIDISGSMSGARIVHSTRALIIFAEVFKKMNIPFELVTFDDDAKHIKKFDQIVDKAMEKKIGGLITHLGGGTNLRYGLDALQLKDREEKNKIAIVITDGGVGYPQQFDDRYFIPWAKKGIKSVGIGIECEPQMKDLCMGNSKVLENASQMPPEFAEIIKTLIKRK